MNSYTKLRGNSTHSFVINFKASHPLCVFVLGKVKGSPYTGY